MKNVNSTQFEQLNASAREAHRRTLQVATDLVKAAMRVVGVSESEVQEIVSAGDMGRVKRLDGVPLTRRCIEVTTNCNDYFSEEELRQFTSSASSLLAG